MIVARFRIGLKTVVNVALTADANAGSSGTGLINLGVPLVSASSAVSTSQAVLSSPVDLSAISASISVVNNVMTASLAISTAAMITSLAAAHLDLNALIQAHAATQSTVNAALTVTQGNQELSAQGNALSHANGAVIVNATLSGIAISKALSQANLSTGQGLSGRASASAGSSGLLMMDVPLTGPAISHVKTVAGLDVMLPVTSAMASASQAAGGLDVSVLISVQALTRALAQASLVADQQTQLSGNSSNSASTTAMIHVNVPLSMNALIHAQAGGNLSQGISNIPKIARWTVVAKKRALYVKARKRRYRVCA